VGCITSDTEEKRCLVKTRVQLLLWLAAVLTCLIALSCNTIEGMGRDIERAGEEIQEAAD